MTHMYRNIHHAMLIALMATVMTLLLDGCRPEDVSDLVPLNMASPAGSQLQSGDEQPKGANVMMRVPAYESGDLFVPGTENSNVPAGVPSFLPYNKLYPTPINRDYSTIGAFLVKDEAPSATSVSGYFRWKEDNSWGTTVGIKKEDYFIFGYMPSNVGSVSATIEKRTGDGTTSSWADGCKMTISNLSTITPADVCVVVGVLKAEVGHRDGNENNHAAGNHIVKSINHADVIKELRQGQYAYEGTEKDNYVYLLLDHLYTNVNMELSVEAKYAELRTIVLTEVYMKTLVRETVNAIVTLTNSPANPIDKIEITTPSGDQPTRTQIFPADPRYTAVVSSDPAHPTSVPGYFAPGMTTQSFEFEFHYDVYDKAHPDDPTNYPYGGNCVRKKCIAINKWSLPGTGVRNGKSFKVTATIRPTYLYMLSDPDLDNPTIVLDNGESQLADDNPEINLGNIVLPWGGDL